MNESIYFFKSLVQHFSGLCDLIHLLTPSLGSLSQLVKYFFLNQKLSSFLNEKRLSILAL